MMNRFCQPTFWLRDVFTNTAEKPSKKWKIASYLDIHIILWSNQRWVIIIQEADNIIRRKNIIVRFSIPNSSESVISNAWLRPRWGLKWSFSHSYILIYLRGWLTDIVGCHRKRLKIIEKWLIVGCHVNRRYPTRESLWETHMRRQ